MEGFVCTDRHSLAVAERRRHALAQEEGYELSESELEGISGGWGVACRRHSRVMRLHGKKGGWR